MKVVVATLLAFAGGGCLYPDNSTHAETDDSAYALCVDGLTATVIWSVGACRDDEVSSCWFEQIDDELVLHSHLEYTAPDGCTANLVDTETTCLLPALADGAYVVRQGEDAPVVTLPGGGECYGLHPWR